MPYFFYFTVAILIWSAKFPNIPSRRPIVHLATILKCFFSSLAQSSIDTANEMVCRWHAADNIEKGVLFAGYRVLYFHWLKALRPTQMIRRWTDFHCSSRFMLHEHDLKKKKRIDPRTKLSNTKYY